LLKLSTDKILYEDEIFKKWTQLYAKNQDLFFEHYIKAHAKLSELGSKFHPKQGFYFS